jgi:alpha-mannosidase
MDRIETLYVVNHSHTDIGFTDYQDLCFRQHAEFIEQALDLCEATTDYPPEARYRWVCEVTGTTERYFRQATQEQRDRFVTWQKRGAIDVAGMQYNLTPMLNIEQMHRSLYPVRRLREKYGVEIYTSMQCDVNGASWLFADLLPAIGIDFFTMAVNPIRGAAPQPRPSAFWWEGPAGGRVLVWNGYHYLFGRSIAKLGDWRFVDRFLPQIIRKLEQDPDYPYDFLYCQSTHPIRVDNGPPDPRMPDFVRDWNASGRTPRIAFTTPTEFGQLLRERFGERLPVYRGDWLDWWSDGVASSAYETGVSRATHEILGVAESIGAWLQASGRNSWDTDRLADIYEHATLYDEHTWGAFASIDAPQALWTKGQWNRKALFAYSASAEAHDVLSRAARTFAHTRAKPETEGMFNLGDLKPEEAYPVPETDEILVLNTLPWPRTILIEEPEPRGRAAPAGVLESFFPRDIPWGGNHPLTPLRRVATEVPAYGFSFISLNGAPEANDLMVGPNCIENAYYRVTIDPQTGAIEEWIDKGLNHDFNGEYRGWKLGQYVYERVDSPDDRNALFAADFSHPEFGCGRKDTPFRRATIDTVKVHPPVIEQGRASIAVDVTGAGITSARCTYSLDTQQRFLAIDWQLDKEHVTAPEAVFIAFPFALGNPAFRADLNGIPCTPNRDQLPGTVRDWYPVQRWVDVSDESRGVTLVPLDAPLVHLGGITTGRWAEELEPEGPTVMSWALHNHWMVNFKASQGGEIPLRYRLTTHAGPCDDAAAARFAAEASVPPIVLRDYRRVEDQMLGSFISILRDTGVLLWAKPAEDSDGVILRLQNVLVQPQTVPLRFEQISPTSVRKTSPVEVDGEQLHGDGATVEVPLAPLAVQSLRVRF